MDSHTGHLGKDLEAMSFAENYHHWILAEFLPFLGNVVAEVGAGTGNFSQLLAATRINRLVAIEPSDGLYRSLLKAVGHLDNVQTVRGFFADHQERFKQQFDTVLYVNVLEHIEDDLGELQLVHESLQENGNLCVFVPALSWLYSDIDKEVGHFRRYHKAPLVSLVESAGFEVVEVKYFDLLGIIPWYVAYVLMKKDITGGDVAVYDKIIVPVMRWIEKRVTPPIGKNLLVVGRKRN